MNKKPLVVLVGPGDCASREELFHLTPWMLDGKIRLAIVGKGQFETVRRNKWRDSGVPLIEGLLGKLPKERLRYFDVDKDPTHEILEACQNPKLVHVTSPNDDHCPSLIRWARALGPDGVATVQKPLTSHPREGQQAIITLKELGTLRRMACFDHYLSKVYPCLTESKIWLRLIGDPFEIDMALLEAYASTPHRAETLKYGMTEDLGAHLFVLLGALTDGKMSPLLKTLQGVIINEAHRARYFGASIPGDTFFLAKGKATGKLGAIDFTIMAGKGIGDPDEAQKRICIRGSKGTLIIDFKVNQYWVERDGKEIEGTRKPTNKPHTKSFLEAILFKEMPLFKAPGVHTLETGVEIARLIRETQERAPKLLSYPVGIYIKGVGTLGGEKVAGMMDVIRMGYQASPLTTHEVPALTVKGLEKWKNSH